MWRSKKPNTAPKYKIPPNAVNYNRARAMKAHAPEMFVKKSLTFDIFNQFRRTGGSELNVSSIMEPLEKLQCKDFNWYLDFFSYIYNDAGLIPKQVFALTPDNGKTCLQLKRSSWGGGGTGGALDEDIVMGECPTISGKNATSGTQWWHPSNRKKDKTCCTGLKVWNTAQCISNGLKTSNCDYMNNSQQASINANKGLLKVGQKQCLTITPSGDLSLTSCAKDVATTTWTKYMPFVPPEWDALSPELQEKWTKKK